VFYAGHPAGLGGHLLRGTGRSRSLQLEPCPGAMATGHETMITATRREIAHGSSPAVITVAGQALPELMKHLKTMRTLVAKDRWMSAQLAGQRAEVWGGLSR
jgi:hypothetical protein